MGSALRQGQGGRQRRFQRAAAVAALLSVAALVAAPWATAGSDSVIPALGSYRASGSGDPPSYTVRGQVKRKAGRKVISTQAVDTCGGFATFAPTAIARAANGTPKFAARVGGAAIRGRWTASTRIAGTVDTPCAKPQGFVMHLAG